MVGTDTFLDDPGDTREEIMRATYLALCEHGYADLTVQRIADEFPKSKSLLYHHYEGKDDLLLDFLEFMLERFEEEVPFEGAGGADELLSAILDHVLATPMPEERRQFGKAMVELRAQAAHDERYRDHFTRNDRFFRERIAEIVRRGVDEGVFREVDPEGFAALLFAVVNGAMVQRATNTDDLAGTVRAQLDTVVGAVLLAED